MKPENNYIHVRFCARGRHLKNIKVANFMSCVKILVYFGGYRVVYQTVAKFEKDTCVNERKLMKAGGSG